MGWLTRLWGRERERPLAETRSTSGLDALLWGDASAESLTGVRINQSSALQATAMLAGTTMLAEDVAKLPWTVKRKRNDGFGEEAKDHFLYDLLDQPNEWQNGFEFREQMQIGLILRGNGYAPIIRSKRGQPLALVPVNPDWVQMLATSSGDIFYKITAQDIHTQAMLRGLPDPLPAEEMFHLRGFSPNGLIGTSRIRAAREAIALSIAQEQTAARFIGNGVRPSGMLTTEQKLDKTAADRLKQDIKDNWAGLQNAGKIIVGEQGLKFDRFNLTASDIDFLASRKFQLEEIARILRIPLHMLGALDRSTNNNIAQQAQEYINYTLTGYTNRWKQKLSQNFGLRKQGLYIDFDYRELTTADMAARVNTWRTMVMSMMGKPDEARIDLGLEPVGGDAAKLQYPQNMATAGSQSTGTAPDDAGRPAAQDSPV